MQLRNFILLILIICISCKDEKLVQKTANKQIEIQFNRNVHTAQIVELLVWNCDSPTRPLMVKAQNEFGNFKDHPAIQLSDSLLLNNIFYFDELIEILLYMEEFPSTKFQYSLLNSPYYADKTAIINRWVQEISDFYLDANIESFLNENDEFYQGAKEEVAKNLPPEDFVDQIESYYRDSKKSYTIIPAPEMCPGGGIYGHRAYGPYVYTKDGLMIYQVLSACLPVEKDSTTNKYTEFGFDSKEYILRNSYHEFGHAFVNTLFEKKQNQVHLEKYDFLFKDELEEAMRDQGYGTWFDCVAEHLVRLGEIRLAARSGNHTWAKELRTYHKEEKKFVLLPELERKILEYEKNQSYKSFEEFLPELLGVLNDISAEEINNRIINST